jgi:hypothetical protein
MGYRAPIALTDGSNADALHGHTLAADIVAGTDAVANGALLWAAYPAAVAASKPVLKITPGTYDISAHLTTQASLSTWLNAAASPTKIVGMQGPLGRETIIKIAVGTTASTAGSVSTIPTDMDTVCRGVFVRIGNRPAVPVGLQPGDLPMPLAPARSLLNEAVRLSVDVGAWTGTATITNEANPPSRYAADTLAPSSPESAVIVGQYATTANLSNTICRARFAFNSAASNALISPIYLDIMAGPNVSNYNRRRIMLWNSNSHEYYAAHGSFDISRFIGVNEGTVSVVSGTPGAWDWAQVFRIDLRFNGSAALGGTEVRVDELTFHEPPATHVPKVVITFDDVSLAAKDLIWWMLEHGIPPTLYIAGFYADSSEQNEAPYLDSKGRRYLTTAELQAMHQAGAFVGNHTYSHRGATGWQPINGYTAKDVAVQIPDVLRQAWWMQERGLGGGEAYLATPTGGWPTINPDLWGIITQLRGIYHLGSPNALVYPHSHRIVTVACVNSVSTTSYAGGGTGPVAAAEKAVADGCGDVMILLHTFDGDGESTTAEAIACMEALIAMRDDGQIQFATPADLMS